MKHDKADRRGNLFANAVAKIITSVFSVISVVNLSLLFHIERSVHCVLNKNKNYAKFFYSRPANNLSQKTSCGRSAIFARCAHFRAIYGESIFSFRATSPDPRATDNAL
jgi:hypothetical protein